MPEVCLLCHPFYRKIYILYHSIDKTKVLNLSEISLVNTYHQIFLLYVLGFLKEKKSIFLSFQGSMNVKKNFLIQGIKFFFTNFTLSLQRFHDF